MMIDILFKIQFSNKIFAKKKKKKTQFIRLHNTYTYM